MAHVSSRRRRGWPLEQRLRCSVLTRFPLRSTPIHSPPTGACATTSPASGARRPICGSSRASPTSPPHSMIGGATLRPSGNNLAELPNRAGATLGTTDPPRHNQLRALLQHAFVKRNLDALSGPIRDMARDAAEALRGRKRFDFVGDFCGDLTVKALSAALGLPPGDEARVRQQRHHDGADRPAHPRQGASARRGLRMDEGLCGEGDRRAARRIRRTTSSRISRGPRSTATGSASASF